MTTRLGLIDYGMGNLHSVQRAFERLNKALQIVRRPADLSSCDALILPGVGAFDPAMVHLEQTQLVPDIKSWVNGGRPLLGICLGLQLLFESSDEGNSKGLGLLKGHVQRLPTNQSERIPHMGWAPLQQRNDCPLLEKDESVDWMYFVHSYAAVTSQGEDLAATAPFGQTSITAMVWKGRLGACQFHPEKSAKAGERLLHHWLHWLESGAKPLT
ncbi:MAG: imidazole glycerol phosphate synthase subunit HisH [Prochlorococcus sp.]